MKGHNSFSYLLKFEPNIPNGFGEILFKLKLEILQRMYGWYFLIAWKELKITQIAQITQLFQLVHLVHLYGHGFYELRRMLMRKTVNSDVSKDSPIRTFYIRTCFSLQFLNRFLFWEILSNTEYTYLIEQAPPVSKIKMKHSIMF